MNPLQQKIVATLKAKGMSEAQILTALTYVAQSIIERTLLLAAEELSEEDLKKFTVLLEKSGTEPEAFQKFVEEKLPGFDTRAKALADDILEDYLLVAGM